MSKKKLNAINFEQTLTDLETIVQHLETGELSLEEALVEFERGVTMARHGQQALKQAEQRVRILLDNDPDSTLSTFDSDVK